MDETTQYDNESIREFWCEVCDARELTTDQHAFDAGWDYPPFIGAYGIVGPRTCGNCMMIDTVWWDIVVNKKNGDTLTEKQLATVARILAETGVGIRLHSDDPDDIIGE